MLILGVTEAGRPLVIRATGSDREPEVWDVVVAREMTEPELTVSEGFEEASDA